MAGWVSSFSPLSAARVVNKYKLLMRFIALLNAHAFLVYGQANRIIREYGSTLYVGLARAVSPTNTNFRLTFLLTRLQEALYEDLAA